MRPLSDLSDRYAALKEPSEEIDGYGTHKCGCTWDSGPYGVYCRQHNPETLIWDALKELCEAGENMLKMGQPRCEFTERFEAAVSTVRRMIDEGVEPAT